MSRQSAVGSGQEIHPPTGRAEGVLSTVNESTANCQLPTADWIL